MASKAPAAEGVQRVQVQQMAGRNQPVSRGSSAGLRNERSAVLQFHGQGYSRSQRMTSRPGASMNLRRPDVRTSRRSTLRDDRAYRNPKLSMDRDLSRLL
jgi:hypothetical protein